MTGYEKQIFPLTLIRYSLFNHFKKELDTYYEFSD